MLLLLAERSVLACDVAEVLCSALALSLLFGILPLTGTTVTAFDNLIVPRLKGKGLRIIGQLIKLECDRVLLITGGRYEAGFQSTVALDPRRCCDGIQYCGVCAEALRSRSYGCRDQARPDHAL
jgi:hypothetical protein